MHFSTAYSRNQSYMRDGWSLGGSGINDEFMLVTTIHLLTLFFVCRFILKYYLGWSSFFFTGWIFIAEMLLLTFISAVEFITYIDFIIFFYTSTTIILFIYLFSFYFRFIIMGAYTFSKYTHYWFKSIIDEINYQLINHFFLKHVINIWNKNILNFISKKKYLKHFLKKKVRNNKILSFMLNTKYYLYINMLSIFYFFFYSAVIFYHFYDIFGWFDHNFFDLYMYYYKNFNWYIFIIYFSFFFRTILNSICFESFLSYNFLRLVNFSKQLEITDDLMDWEPSYFETIVVNEEFTPEDMSIYLIDADCGVDSATTDEGIYEDLETTEVNYRFHFPAEWLNYKTYVIDSYDNNILRYFFNIFEDYLLWFLTDEDYLTYYGVGLYENHLFLKF